MSRRYVVRKVAQTILTIFAIVLLNFVLFRLLPGDPVDALVPRRATQEQRQQIRLRLGLDQPLLPITIAWTNSGPQLVDFPRSLTRNQLFAYLGNLMAFDLGESFKERKPVVEVLAGRIWPTLLLVGLAEIIAIFLGLTIGIRAGWKRGSRFDTLSINLSLAFYSIPLFWLGMILLLLFASPAGVKIFPTGQMVTPGVTFANPLDYILNVAWHLVLPVTTLALGYYAGYALVMRTSIVDVMAEDYVVTARAKGLRERDILRRHAIPNAMLPTVTLIALAIGYVVGGAIGVEEVFTWPGLGNLTVDAIAAKDFPVLQGIFLLLTVTVVVANLVADLYYGTLDPRVRTG